MKCFSAFNTTLTFELKTKINVKLFGGLELI